MARLDQVTRLNICQFEFYDLALRKPEHELVTDDFICCPNRACHPVGSFLWICPIRRIVAVADVGPLLWRRQSAFRSHQFLTTAATVTPVTPAVPDRTTVA